MADEARLHELLDLVEQARSEGDKDTEAKAAAAYRAESSGTPATPQRSPVGFVDEMKAAGGALKQGAGMIARGVGSGIVGAPMMVADAISQARNLISPGSVSELPSETFRGMQNASLPQPQNAVDQTIEGLTSAAVGAKIPSPSQLPVAVDMVSQSLAQARTAGYVIPPGLGRPGPVKAAVAQLAGNKQLNAEATGRNLSQMTTNVANDFGLPKGTEITHDTMEAVRAEAGNAYQAVRELGPWFANKVDEIKSLRSNASGYYRQNSANYNHDVQQKADGMWDQAVAQDKKLADAVKQSGKSELYDDLITARTTIAKTHDVDKALVDSRGELKPKQFEKLFEKEKPITGAILDAGRSTQAFRQAFTTSGGQPFSMPDAAVLGSGVGLGYFGTHDPKVIAMAALGGLGRYGARKAQLSGPVQDSLAFLSPEQRRAALAEAVLRGQSVQGFGQ